MCGIFGILNLKGKLDTSIFNLPNSTDVLYHRGPDDFGHFLEFNVYLAQRRLSIIDLDSGKQPIFNEDNSVCVIFNGEIYNFLELRRELERFGHRFNTKTDTETIVHAYEQWGSACVNRLRGMFAFALWDNREKLLLLARDRLGIKPLFYAVHNGVFYFASEMKAILQFSFFPREIDPHAVAAFFNLSYIPGALTIYRHIRKLEPAHILEIRGGEIKINKYWDLYFEPDESRTEKQFIDGLIYLLEESIDLRMISDVPLGAFLSGGIDSGTVVAIMSRLQQDPVRTFTMGFGGQVGGHLDEREYARQVADECRTIHVQGEVRPNVIGIVENIVRSFDEPFADASTIPSYYLYQIAKKKVTVALSGLGGDEVFGGYERYLGFKFSLLYNRLPWWLREKFVRNLVERLPERSDGHYSINHMKRFVRSASTTEDERYFGFVSMMVGTKKGLSLFSEPHKFNEGMEKCQEYFRDIFNSSNATDPLDKIFYTDIKTYLPEDILACTDRMSMFHSLEVRVPFIDHKFLEFCAKIPNRMKIRWYNKKYILKKAINGMLPSDVLSHRKQGFVGPMTQWLQTDLKDFSMDILSTRKLDKHGMFNNRTVNLILEDHFSNKEQNDKIIWALIMFQKWYESYIES